MYRKAQYEGQFKRWNIRKNLTAEEWGYVHSQIEKRKFDEKESDVYLHGRLIPSKRVKKEISRRFPPTLKNSESTGNIRRYYLPACIAHDKLTSLKESSSNLPEAVFILTPEPVHDYDIGSNDLTWAQSPEMARSPRMLIFDCISG